MTNLRSEEYFQNGYVTCPAFVEPMQLERLLAEAERISDGNTLAAHDKTRMEMEPNQNPDGKLIRRIYEPCSYYAPFRELSESAKVLDAIESLIGPDIFFHYSKINMKPPAIGSVVEWHQDLSYFPLTNDSCVTLLIYLDDADVENGCLQVLQTGRNTKILECTQDGYFVGKIVEPLDGSKALPLEGKAGTAIFMHCLTPHSSITNRSSRPRRTLILGYRAADAFPIYAGSFDTELEAHVRLVRGKSADHARFSFQELMIPRRRQHVASLYQLQESTRKPA